MTEAEILADIMLKVGSRPDVRIWRNNTGTAKSRDGKRFVRFGMKGAGDLIGLMRVEKSKALDVLVRIAATVHRAEDLEILRRALQPTGRLLSIEAKTEVGRLSPEQKVFQRVIESFGGLYIVARSGDDAFAQVEAACR